MTIQTKSMIQTDVELDASGLHCPMPVLKAKKALTKMQSGQVLHLITTDLASMEDVPALVNHLNCELLESSTYGSKFLFYIRK